MTRTVRSDCLEFAAVILIPLLAVTFGLLVYLVLASSLLIGLWRTAVRLVTHTSISTRTLKRNWLLLREYFAR